MAWNEEARLGPLLDEMSRWFGSMVVGVQESTDETLRIAEALANRATDQVIREPHLGFGDASMPRLVRAARTPWVFVLAADEWPNDELLASLGTCTAYADRGGFDGVWLPFESITEGIKAADTQSGHLRLFRRSLGWPETLHSRPSAKRDLWWPFGHVTHERSLDEMMRDYLRYFEIGRGNPAWEAHNRLMMHDACAVIAQHRGWAFVQAFEWWPAVRDLVFEGKEPDG